MGKLAQGYQPIDFRAVADRADLRSIIVGELGQPTKKKWKCPFHDDHSPSLAITRDGKRFICYACGVKGDALEWVVKRANVSVVEAARQLDPSLAVTPESKVFVGSKQASPVVTPAEVKASFKPDADSPWRDAGWQAEAEALVVKAEALLWSDEGAEALDWLRARGLADTIITMFRLGFLPDWHQTEHVEVLGDKDGPRGIKAPRGIVFPWLAPEAWYCRGRRCPIRWCGINVRKLRFKVEEEWVGPADKCLAVAGSRRGYAYPHADLTPGVNALIVEGETDALLAFQHVGHMVNVTTTGSASTPPKPELLAELSGCPFWLIATDHDDAGDDAAAAWRARGPMKCRRLQLPHGKDVGEFVQAGGDLRSWLKSEMERLGIDPDD